MSAEPQRGTLGRGLAALIPQRAPANSTVEVPLAHIRDNPYQPRTGFDEQSFAALVESVRQHGVLQPVIVREALDGYHLIAGGRRVRAAQLAGLERIPAIVRQADDHTQLVLALVENIQRADLGPLEEAAAFRRLIDDFGLSQERVAEQVGRSRSSVANTLRLLHLAEAVQQALGAGRISEGHARALGGLDLGAQTRVLDVVLSRGFSVRDTEEMVRRIRDGGTQRGARMRGPVRDAELDHIEAELRSALGTKVRLTRSRRGGRIVIEYYSDEDLDRLYERLVTAPRFGWSTRVEETPLTGRSAPIDAVR